MTLTLGAFTESEIPNPLVYTYQDSAGAVINLTGYTAKFVYVRHGGSAVTRSASVSTPLSGQVTYTWVTGDMDADGIYTGEFHVSNGTNRYVSEPIVWRVRDAVTVPTIP